MKTGGLLGPFSLGGLDYLVREPSKGAGPGPHPVLCFLHGRGECAAKLGIRAAAKAHGPLQPKASKTARRFIVVFPQLPGDGGDIWTENAAAVIQIVKRVQHDYGGDRTRTYLSGFSYGANGALRIGSQKPRPWAALWPVDPPSVHKEPARRPIWLWYGTKSHCRSANKTTKGEHFLNLDEVSPGGLPNKTRLATGLEQTHPQMGSEPYRDSVPYKWLLRHHRPFRSRIRRRRSKRRRR